jgi:uncharacterized membrane protein YeaQ/YmgE (transglycosylase-associated protein family)
MDPKTQQIVIFLLIGLVAGWLASFVVQGGGLLQYLLSGVIGAFVGGFVLDALGIRLGIKNPLLAQIVTATIGAIIVVLLARLIS